MILDDCGKILLDLHDVLDRVSQYQTNYCHKKYVTIEPQLRFTMCGPHKYICVYFFQQCISTNIYFYKYIFLQIYLGVFLILNVRFFISTRMYRNLI